ncbi:hypothetical protein CSAL01_11074 [Colletotrichum salicis]|uniref:Uncharacterized protein n=1 Tax=Colletotrichum salicis TaxID=1209931 RepID=A0A135SGZ4_9PEZI|nr:hypothetical protein CSAL01_11074 [Colletotrichum salicis]
MDDIPLAPTNDERKFYYHGFPSRPELVARSSTHTWSRRMHGWLPVEKTVGAVGEHSIVPKWNDETGPDSLRQQVINILHSEQADWHTIGILRIGYVDKDVFPVILCIAVGQGSSTWEQGISLAMQCRTVLEQHGLHDVHCEIRRSHAFNLTRRKFPCVIHQDNFASGTLLHPLSDQLGTSMTASDWPTREGKKGLYLRRKPCSAALATTDADAEEEVYVLTCRHVCFDESERGKWLPGSIAAPEKKVVQPGETTFTMKAKEIEAVKNSLQSEGTNANEWGSTVFWDDSRKQKELDRENKMLRDSTQAFELFKKRQGLESRIIGSIPYARAYNIRGNQELSDWCLIRLDSEAHENFSALANRVLIDGGDLYDRFRLKSSATKIAMLDDDHALQLRGMATLAELTQTLDSRHGTLNSFSLQDSKTFFVGKRGRSSGLTFGEVNQVKSVRRKVCDGTPTLIATELCILADARKVDASFSRCGDSGACVFDIAGRVVGTVTSGVGRDTILIGEDDFYLDRAVDITYVTPLEWSLQDMESCGLMMDIL